MYNLKDSRSLVQKREVRRLGLQTFFLSIENNHYDYIASKQIKELESKLHIIRKEIKPPSLGESRFDYFDIYFTEKQLYALSEMQITYAYKHFEIHLKFLLKASYPEIKEDQFYKWHLVEEFLNSRSINTREIPQYSELKELRNLNNTIKHSRNILDNNTRNIIEFRKKKEIGYTDLNNFYNRIQECGIEFLKSLSLEIEKDLYVFNDDRIDKIGDKIISRMDKESIDSLILNIQQKQ